MKTTTTAPEAAARARKARRVATAVLDVLCHGTSRTVALYSRAAAVVGSLTEPQWAALCATADVPRSSSRTWRLTRDATMRELDRMALRAAAAAGRSTLRSVGDRLAAEVIA
jgi:hypothetical protein